MPQRGEICSLNPLRPRGQCYKMPCWQHNSPSQPKAVTKEMHLQIQFNGGCTWNWCQFSTRKHTLQHKDGITFVQLSAFILTTELFLYKTQPSGAAREGSSSGISAKPSANPTNKKSSPLHVAIKSKNRWGPAAPASPAQCS